MKAFRVKYMLNRDVWRCDPQVHQLHEGPKAGRNTSDPFPDRSSHQVW